MKAFIWTVDATTEHLLGYILYSIKMVKIVSATVGGMTCIQMSINYFIHLTTKYCISPSQDKKIK